MLVVVADASPLIFLSRIHRLGLLERFAKALIPVPVFEEVRDGAAKDPQSTPAVSAMLKRQKAELRSVEVPAAFTPTWVRARGLGTATRPSWRTFYSSWTRGGHGPWPRLPGSVPEAPLSSCLTPLSTARRRSRSFGETWRDC